MRIKTTTTETEIEATAEELRSSQTLGDALISLLRRQAILVNEDYEESDLEEQEDEK